MRWENVLEFIFTISHYYSHHSTCFVSSDNCKKLGLVFENVVGIVEIINSNSIQLQVSGALITWRVPYECEWTEWIDWTVYTTDTVHVSSWDSSLCCRCWEQSRLFPSTRRRAARCTWARTPWTVKSSAPRALRWTSWFRQEMTIT